MYENTKNAIIKKPKVKNENTVYKYDTYYHMQRVEQIQQKNDAANFRRVEIPFSVRMQLLVASKAVCSAESYRRQTGYALLFGTVDNDCFIVTDMQLMVFKSDGMCGCCRQMIPDYSETVDFAKKAGIVHEVIGLARILVGPLEKIPHELWTAHTLPNEPFQFQLMVHRYHDSQIAGTLQMTAFKKFPPNTSFAQLSDKLPFSAEIPGKPTIYRLEIEQYEVELQEKLLSKLHIRSHGWTDSFGSSTFANTNRNYDIKGIRDAADSLETMLSTSRQESTKNRQIREQFERLTAAACSLALEKEIASTRPRISYSIFGKQYQ